MKILKYFVILVCLFFTLSASTCSSNDDDPSSFIFKNNSTKSIYLQNSDPRKYTSWNCDRHSGLTFVQSNKSYTYDLGSPRSWKKEFDRLKKVGIDYLQLIAIDSLVYKTNDCDSIQKNNLILKRYKINLDTLERYNWTITYP